MIRILMLLTFAIQGRKVLIFTSNQTSIPDFTNYLSNYDFVQNEFVIKVHEVQTTTKIEEILASENFDYTIDFTESVNLTYTLILSAENRKIFNFVFGGNYALDLSKTNYSFLGSLNIKQRIDMVCEFLVPISLETQNHTALIAQNDVMNTLRRFNISACDRQFAKLVYLSNNYENIKSQIGLEIKSQGIRLALIFVEDGKIGEYVIRALSDKFIGGSGYEYGILGESVHVFINSKQMQENILLNNGMLFYIEHGTASARSDEEVQALKIQNLLQKLVDVEVNQRITKQLLLQLCYNDDHTLKEYMNVLNSQNGTLVNLRKFSYAETITYNEPIYPGGESSVDISGKILIEFSHFDNHWCDTSDWKDASLMALAEIEILNLLPENFQLQPYFFACSESHLSNEFLYDMLNPSQLTGHLIALFGISNDDTVKQIYEYEYFQNNSNTVHMYPNTYDSNFSDKVYFPNFNRLTPPSWVSTRTGSLGAQFLDWKNMAVLYDRNQGSGIQSYSEFLKVSAEQGINIQCDDYYHGFDASWDKSEFITVMKPWLDEIIDSRARIFHILSIAVVQNNWVMEYFYEQGLRSSDLLVMYNDDLAGQILLSDLKSTTPLYELYWYSIHYSNSNGPDEQQYYFRYRDKFLEKYGIYPISKSCYFYDAMYHFYHALDRNILQGQDYEIPSILNLFMKQVRFTGCSGQITFDQQTNDRRFLKFYIGQNVFNETKDDFDFRFIGYYNPYSSPFFSISNFYWPDGSIPSDTRPLYKDWPYEEYQISDNENGRMIMYITGVIITIHAWIFTIVFYHQHRFLNVIKIQKTFFGMGDIIFFLISGFEFWQLLSLIPSLIGQESTEMRQQISIYPMIYLNISEDIIYMQMHIAYAIFTATVFTWVFLKVQCPNLDIIYVMRFLLTLVCGFVLYIPVISMLIDVFICTEEAKGIVFFDVDCNNDCWNFSHIVYCILTSFVLVQVIPAAMYLRMKYQEITSDLNILWNPGFIFIKILIITCMIVASKVLKYVQSSILAVVLSVGMLTIVGLHISLQPFNYRRIDLYLSTIGFIYVSIVMVSALPISQIFMIITIVSLTSMILIIWFILQSKFPIIFPLMLQFPKSHKIENMIKFQFSTGDNILYKGQKKESFILKISHKLQNRTSGNKSEIIESTEMFEVNAPCVTLN